MPHQRVFGIFYDQGGIYAGIHKPKYHWENVSWNILIKVRGGNIASVSNILPYKSKVIHVEDYILNFDPLIQNINYYPREENNCGDDSSMSLLNYYHFWDTIIAGNIYLSSNDILGIIDSALSSLHVGIPIGDAKYRI